MPLILKFCPGCGTRQPLLGSGGKTLGRCILSFRFRTHHQGHVCKVKQALDSKECTHCGTEDPVRYIEHFTDIKYYLAVSLILFLFSPLFGLFTGIFSVMYCIFYPRKEVVAKPSKKKAPLQIEATSSPTKRAESLSSLSKNNSEENLCQICFALPRNTILIP